MRIFSVIWFSFFIAMLNSNREPLFKVAPPCCTVIRPLLARAFKSRRIVMADTASSAASSFVST